MDNALALLQLPLQVSMCKRKESPTSTEPVRLEYQTMTVEQILNMFQQEMEMDASVLKRLIV
jgi:hypothetical protein